MKYIAYAFALAPALIATPALAQAPAAPPAAAPAKPPAAPAAKPPAAKPPAAPAAKPPTPAAAAPAAPAPAAPPPAAAAPAAAPPAAAAPAAEPVAPAEPAPAPIVEAPPPAAPAPAPVEPVPAAPAPAAAAEAPAPAAPAADPSSLELFGTIAPTVTQGEPANPRLTNSLRRVGFYGEGGVAYRSKYFLDPFFSVGYGTLASGDTTIPDNPVAGPGTLHQHLGMWVLSPGVTSDIWRFRLRFGIGIAIVKQSFSFQGEDNTASQKPLVWQVGLGFNCYKAHRFRLDAEARFVEAKGADVSFWMLGVTGRGDVATF